MSLGSTLRGARESARLSIDDLAAMTRIRARLLEQMESDDFAACGGDAYARGHLRTIAAKLNIDAQELLDLYRTEHSAEQRSIQSLLVESNVTTAQSESKKISFKTLSLVSVAILASAAIIQIVVSNTSQSPLVKSPAASESAAASAIAAASATAAASPSTSASAISPSAPTTLKIVATRGNAVVDVVTKDGHLFKGWILQGESKEFTSDSRISIYLSNAGDLDVFINGEAIPPLGLHNQEVRRTFP